MTITILIVINVFAAVGIIALVLLQQGKSDISSAFGGGGGSQSMFGSRGSANFLSRTTSILATVFFLSSLALAYLYAQRDEQRSVVTDSSVVEQVEEAASETAVKVEAEVPSVPGGESNEVEQTKEGESVEAESSSEVPAVPQ